jgi:WD40 repeat protein
VGGGLGVGVGGGGLGLGLGLESNWGQLQKGKIGGLVVTPCGRYLLTLGSDGGLRQWKVESKEMVRDYGGAGEGTGRGGAGKPVIRNKQFNA